MSIFVSHAHADAPIVGSFVKMLLKVGVPDGDIYCTSLPRHGVKIGSDFERDIRRKLKDSQIAIALLSDRYYASAYCMFELGGIWASGKHVFPFLLPTIKVNDLRGPIDKRQCPSIKEADRLDELRKAVLGRASKRGVRSWEKIRAGFLQEVEKRYRGSEYLKGVRTRLNQNGSFQRVLTILKAEREGVVIASKMSEFKRRDLPGFLEDEVGTPLKERRVSAQAAYDTVGTEVLLCDNSTWLWEGEKPPKSPRHWRVFNDLAAAIRSEAEERS